MNIIKTSNSVLNDIQRIAIKRKKNRIIKAALVEMELRKVAAQ